MEDIKKTYSDAQKKATAKYRQNNKEKVNEQRKKYYQARKDKDPHFLEYKRTKAKEYYQRKKIHKDAVEDFIEEHKLKTEEPKEIIVQVGNVLDVEDVSIEPEVIKVEEKPKRSRAKKNVKIEPEPVIEPLEKPVLIKNDYIVDTIPEPEIIPPPPPLPTTPVHIIKPKKTRKGGKFK